MHMRRDVHGMSTLATHDVMFKRKVPMCSLVSFLQYTER
jgi:hypothetical protein